MRIKALIAALFVSALVAGFGQNAQAGLFVSISVAPPPLPVYAQPPIPGPGYIWSPGYWSWDDDDGDYYWVPGAWVPAPEPGLLWTPGYWGWSDGVYVWNAGYWGPHVGFYGGVCYGFGYVGVGFAGGYWAGGVFTYNRSVTNIGTSVTITNVYNKTVVTNNVTNVSYNGGSGGIKAQPNAQELAAAHDHHIQATSEQLQHQQLARNNPDLKASKNHGKPPIAAVRRAGDFSKGNVFAAKSAGGSFRPASLKTNNGPGKSQSGIKRTSKTPGVKPFGGSNNNTSANVNAHTNTLNKNNRQNLNLSKANGNASNGAPLTRKPGGPKLPPNRPVGKQPSPPKDKKPT